MATKTKKKSSEYDDSMSQWSENPVKVSAWVKIAHGSSLPEEVWGLEAVVERAPFVDCDECVFSPRPHTHQPKDATFLIYVRSRTTGHFEAVRSDFAEVSHRGRVGLNAVG